MTRKIFKKELKLEVIKLVWERGMSFAQMARDLDRRNFRRFGLAPPYWASLPEIDERAAP